MSSKPHYDYYIERLVWTDERGYRTRKKGPCIVYSDGTIFYANADGDYHRTDGPAIIDSDGSKEYWINGYELSVDEFFLKFGVL